MSKHHDKLIERLTVLDPKPRKTEPRTPQQVESFVKGFGLSAAATRQIVEEWLEDIRIAHSQGYDQGYDNGRWDE